MSTYTLKIEIGQNLLEGLKREKLNLCLAKKVNGAYTVVWMASPSYLLMNQLTWTEAYEVFATKPLKVGALVQLTSNAEDIKFGQTCTLEKDSSMSPPSGTPDDSGRFFVLNETAQSALGVGQKLNGGGPEPIFVSPTLVSGKAVFEPSKTVAVWFEEDQKAGDMIFDVNANHIEVSFDGKTTQCVSYTGDVDNGQWSIV